MRDQRTMICRSFISTPHERIITHTKTVERSSCTCARTWGVLFSAATGVLQDVLYYHHAGFMNTHPPSAATALIEAPVVHDTEQSTPTSPACRAHDSNELDNLLRLLLRPFPVTNALSSIDIAVHCCKLQLLCMLPRAARRGRRRMDNSA